MAAGVAAVVQEKGERARAAGEHAVKRTAAALPAAVLVQTRARCASISARDPVSLDWPLTD